MQCYLDHNSTTPLDNRVLDAMLPYLRDRYGNPSSIHGFGRIARAAVEAARERVAALVHAHPSQVIFTSGGSEANNFALKGVCTARPVARIAVSAIEHASLLEPARAVQAMGWGLDLIPVDGQGRVQPDAVVRATATSTSLVSVMMANNETGVVQDISAISAVIREKGILMHTDAVQAAGKIPVDFSACGVQLMSLSAHKIYGPKGVGALIVDKSIELWPLIHGGGQERDLRGGTENVAGIVGFGAAAELALEELEQRAEDALALRKMLEDMLSAALPEVRVLAHDAERLPNTVMLSVPAIDGETLVMNLDRAGYAVSSGSACSATSTEPSHVLVAMGMSELYARNVIRVSLGQGNRAEDVRLFVRALQKEVGVLKAMGASWAG